MALEKITYNYQSNSPEIEKTYCNQNKRLKIKVGNSKFKVVKKQL